MTEKYTIGDIYIGNFPISQTFGQNSAWYEIYGLSGHNGFDIATPKRTPVLAAADGIAQPQAFDPNGFGKWIKVQHTGFYTLYGHLDEIVVPIGQKVVKGQLLGYSGNTGNVKPRPTESQPDLGSHLHFGLYPSDNVGNKTEKNNGFGGAIDPLGKRVIWQTVNPTVPINPNAPSYEHGGWYDNPKTGKNQRWWETNGKGDFLPVGISHPDEIKKQYRHGGWYDDPEDGKNKKWWVDSKGEGRFLPHGITEPKDLFKTYNHGGWYTNYETGENQRWWVKDGEGKFLDPGVVEPVEEEVKEEVKQPELPPVGSPLPFESEPQEAPRASIKPVTETDVKKLQSMAYELQVNLYLEQANHDITRKKLEGAEIRAENLRRELNAYANTPPSVTTTPSKVQNEVIPQLPETNGIIESRNLQKILQSVFDYVKRNPDVLKTGNFIPVKTKEWYKSSTVIFNAVAFLAVVVTIIIESGAISDAELMALAVSFLNILNRLRTTTPVSIKK